MLSFMQLLSSYCVFSYSLSGQAVVHAAKRSKSLTNACRAEAIIWINCD